jgi:TATA-box binding protein (TBP) (component of TFIID and TFIIIB)
VSSINSVYTSGIKLDCTKLRNVLTAKNMRVELDKNVHAGVNLKINKNNHDITVIIFESGKIMINSSRNCLEILDVCQFINDFMVDNYDICV